MYVVNTYLFVYLFIICMEIEMLNIDPPETLICDNANIIKMILDTRHLFYNFRFYISQVSPMPS